MISVIWIRAPLLIRDFVTYRRKVELIWEPLQLRFMEENGQLSGSNHATSTGLGMKCDFRVQLSGSNHATSTGLGMKCDFRVQLSGSNHATSTGLGMKCDFRVKALQQKYALMSSKYKDLKRCCKAGRHELRGETGSAAEGEASTVQEAIENAAKFWSLFAAWHAAFGEVQRLREDTSLSALSQTSPVTPTVTGHACRCIANSDCLHFCVSLRAS
jgi:predicted small metal-binding protein